MWVYPPNCRTKVGTRWSPSFPRQSLARRRARNIVQVHAHALNGSWECYHVVRIGLGAIWGDHGRRRSLHFTTPHFCLKKGWVYPPLSITQKKMPKQLVRICPSDRFCRVQNLPTSSVELFWPIKELYFRQILSTDFMNRFYQDVKTGPYPAAEKPQVFIRVLIWPHGHAVKFAHQNTPPLH